MSSRHEDLEAGRALLSTEEGEEDWDQRKAELSREARENPVLDAERVDQLVFAQTVFNVKERTRALHLKILRFGPADRSCIVKLTTEQGSLKPNEFDGRLDRNLLFDPNEREKTLELGMHDDGTWDGIRMCPIILSVVQSVRDTKVEERGCKALIVVSDADAYPENVEPPTLFAFLKNQRKNRGTKLLKTMASLAYMGITSVIETVILKIVVDTVVKDDAAFQNGADNPRERRQIRLYYCALAYFVSFYADYSAHLVFKENRGFGGTTKWLRDKLFSKFLHLSEVGVTQLSNGQFLGAALWQTEELTTYGWVQSLVMWRAIITIIANLILQLYLLANKMPLQAVVPFCLVVPTFILIVMLLGYIVRNAKKQAMLRARQDAEMDWTGCAQEIVHARQLVQQYNVSEAALKEFRMIYDRFWKTNREASTYQMKTQFIPKWFFAICLVCVYASIPYMVRLLAFGAGDLAALVKSWMKLNSGCNHAYGSALSMARAQAALEKIADTLNRTDRVSERIDHEVRVEKDNTLPRPSVPKNIEDLDVVRFEKVSFQYEASDEILDNVNAEIRCHDGGLWLLVCPEVTGPARVPPQGRGRRTILRLLSQMMFPTEGRLTMPAFRRIVYVDRAPVVLDSSVFRNLSFGRAGGLGFHKVADARDTTGAIVRLRSLSEEEAAKGLSDEEAAKQAKLRELCRWTAQAMGLSRRLYGNLDKMIGGGGLDSLTTVDATALVLARAFLSEAELLLVDHVADGLGAQYLGAKMVRHLHCYARGGLRMVLQESGIDCPAEVLPPPPTVKPLVIWSPLCPPKEVWALATGVIEVDDQKQISVKRQE